MHSYNSNFSCTYDEVVFEAGSNFPVSLSGKKAGRNVVNSRDDVISRRESAADNLTSFNSDVRQREFN